MIDIGDSREMCLIWFQSPRYSTIIADLAENEENEQKWHASIAMMIWNVTEQRSVDNSLIHDAELNDLNWNG